MFTLELLYFCFILEVIFIFCVACDVSIRGFIFYLSCPIIHYILVLKLSSQESQGYIFFKTLPTLIDGLKIAIYSTFATKRKISFVLFFFSKVT